MKQINIKQMVINQFIIIDEPLLDKWYGVKRLEEWEIAKQIVKQSIDDFKPFINAIQYLKFINELKNL